MSNELKPCPFCGGEVLFHRDEECDGCHYIECSGCRALFDFATAADPENESETVDALREAIAPAWNRRAQPAEAEGVEVVAWRHSTTGAATTDRVKVAGWFRECVEPLMTVDQHERILSAVTAERDRLLATAYDEAVEGDHNLVPSLQAELVTLRAEVEALRKDAALGSAIQRACCDLPEGFMISVSLENDAGTLELCLPDTDAVLDDFDGETFADKIHQAINAAMAAKEGYEQDT